MLRCCVVVSLQLTLNKYSPCCLLKILKSTIGHAVFHILFTSILCMDDVTIKIVFYTVQNTHFVENGVCILGCKSQFLSCRLFNKYLFNRIFDAFQLS